MPANESLGARVLVTGAGGFIGSRLTEVLVEAGCRVRAFVHYRSSGHRGWLDDSPLAGDLEFVSGDVRDPDVLARACSGCHAIFHLAALVGIPYSYLSPGAYLRTNVDGCLHMLEAARAHNVERVIVTSTSEVYGSAQHTPMTESHPLNCQSPYAASKAAADHLALSYERAFQIPVTIVRPFNVFGPRQSARALIPAVATQVLGGCDEVHMGNFQPTRDFTFVDDTVRAFVAIAQEDLFVGRVVHIGTGEERSALDVTRDIIRVAGRNARIVEDDARKRPQTSEVTRLVCDSSLLRSQTGWQPVVSFEDGLRRTLEWLGRHLSAYRAGEYCV